MRTLTVLGSCAAWPEAGRAASGFLLEYDGFRLVLDLGYATFPRLLDHCAGDEIDAVAVTHEHPDHCADLSALCRERYFARDRSRRTPLFCTPGVVERVQAMEPNESLSDVFEVHLLPGGGQVGPFRLDGIALPHHVPHAGIRVAAADLVVGYSGDAGPDSALLAVGGGADLFIMGATWQGDAGADTDAEAGPDADAGQSRDGRLLSAAEAGTWASRAGARRLLLTHFWPGADREVSLAEARGRFDGEVLLADEGLVVHL